MPDSSPPVAAAARGRAAAESFASAAPPPAPRLALTVQAAPEEVAAGGTVTVTVRLANTGAAAASGVVISGTVPAGLDCPGCAGFYDPDTRRLQWGPAELAAGAALTHTFGLQVQAEAGRRGGFPLTLGARAQNSARPARGSAVVRVTYPVVDGPAEAVLPAGQAGELVAADGRLTLTFPLEAVGAGLTVAYSPTQAMTPSRYARPLRTFAVEARDTGGHAVHTFDRPVRLVYRYTWGEAVGLDPAELYFTRYDADQGVWVRLPTEVDVERQLLSGYTDHFSEIQVEYFKLPSEDYLPAVQGFQEIDLFSGAASYAYPLEVPPGRGGLGPQLNLSYSSAAVDWPARPWDPNVQAGWVGYGWSMEGSYVGRQNVGGYAWTGDEETCEQAATPYTGGDVYNLVLNGSGNDLVLGTDGYYHTAAESFAQVWSSGGDDPEGWYVRTTDGAVYSFTTRLWQLDCDTDCSDHPREWDHQVYKWLLTTAGDTHGNTVHYTYTLSTVNCPNPGGGETLPCQEAYYLSAIGYNDANGTALMRLEFVLGDREDDTYAPHDATRCPAKFLQKKKLDEVEVYVGGELAWEYRFDYDYLLEDDDVTYFGVVQKKLTLLGVQRCGTNDDGSTFTCLPATRFGYYGLGTPANPQIGRNRLFTATNGYGGVVTYTYEVAGEINNWRNRVVEREVDDGLGQVAAWSYDYSLAQRNWPYIADSACDGVSADAGTDEPRARPIAEFRGHAAVTLTDPLGNVQFHYFHLDDTRRGQPAATQQWDSLGNLYQAITPTYATYAFTATAYPTQGYTFATPEIAFTYVATQTTATCDGATSCKVRRTRNHYEPAGQGGAQYGNRTRVEEYDENGALYRTTQWGYYPNTTDWIVSLPGYQNVYAGAAAAENVRASTYYLYDGQGTGQAPGALGELTREVRVRTYPTQTAQTRYLYDGYGNRTAEIGYESWGLCYYGGSCAPPADPVTTTIAYNVSAAGFHLYPERVTYPNGRSETASYSYTHGLLLTHTDVNGATTTYRYDPLGRVVGVIRPDDTGYPTTEVEYKSFGQPGAQHVLVRQRETYQGGTLDTERFFDGLGRPIQVHTEAGGGQEIMATTLHDPLGRTTAEVSPFLTTTSAVYVAPLTTWPRTRSAYDALGRTIAVTNTDGTTARTYYDRWRMAAVDPAGHVVVQENDAFGRLAQVEEYTYTLSGVWDWDDLEEVYATTVYTYNVRDQLLAVTDTVGNATHLTYDLLGQKTAMADPDMGTWSYAYDPRGNLVSQVDARGQEITFTYDLLNRLTLKSLPGAEDAHFCYDDCLGQADANATYSWGRLRWAWVGAEETANGRTYRYDARGRTISDTVWVDDQGYTTRSTFDSLDRVVALTYPGGEVVTTTYDVRGQPATLSGAVDYVTGAAYNALGQTTALTLGNGLQTTYLYDDAGLTPSYRLTEIRTGTEQSPTARQRLWYDYDDVGNVLAIRDYGLAANGSSYQELTFGYDELNRLRWAEAVQGVDGSNYGFTGSNGYTYDEIGNLLTKEGATYAYPAAGAARPHAVMTVTAGMEVYTYTYDANGNMTAGAGRTLAWDAENRPTAIATALGTTTFVYGPGGERVKVVEPDGNYTVYAGAHYERYVDPTRPYVTATVPAGGQADFPVGGALAVTFSEAVVTGSFTLTNQATGLPVAGTLGPLVLAGVVCGVRFTPTTALELVTPYTAEVGGFTDRLGNDQAPDPYAWTFATTGVDYSDDLAGEVDSPPEEAWHTAGPNGWQLGGTATYGEGQVCQPPEDDDGVWRGGQNPAGDHFTATEGTTLTVQVVVQGPASGTGQLGGWVDWDDDGTFTQVYNQTLNAAGAYPAALPVPLDSCQYDPLAMRWRVGDSGSAPAEEWSGGEVEDYVLDIMPVPPAVVAASPSGAGIPLAVIPAVVTMSEAVHCPAGSDCGPQVTDLRTGAALSGTVGVAGAVAAFTPTAALSECTPYVGLVQEWADVCGGQMASAYTWNWYTVAIPPELVTTTPAPSATDVPVESVLVVTMSEPLFCPTVQGAGCEVTLVRDSSGWEMPGETGIVGSGVYFTPVVPLMESTGYTATVRGFVDSCGAPMAAYTWTFATEAIPPEVLTTAPLPGATCVAWDTVLLVTFTEDVNSSVGPDFSVVGPAGEITGTAGFIRPIGIEGEEFWARTAYFTPSLPLAEKAWYAAALGGVEDRDRHKMEEPYYWGFLSRDVTAPQVTATDPASNAPDGYPDEPLTAWYDEAVDWPSQVQGQGNSFTLVGPGGGVSGTVGVVLDLYGRSGIRFTPASTLTALAPYTATIVGAVDLCSNAALTHTWSFTTACLVDAAALELAPAGCARDEAVFQTSAVFFQSSGGSTMTVAAYEWAILAANGYEVLTTVVTTAPTLTRELPYPGEVRWVRVRGQDAAGCLTHWSLGRELSWEGCYPGAPQVVGASPLGQQTEVTVTAGLVVTFSEVVLAPPVLQDSRTQVRLYAGGSPVAGEWHFTDRYDGQWAWGARFTPTNELAEKTWHLGSVTGMQDSHGNRMTVPYGWVFRTGDYSPPAVVATYPAGETEEEEGQEPAPPDAALTITFDERLDETRLDEVEFSLVGPGGAVSGTLAAQPAIGLQTVLRFTPDGPLNEEARYTATVGGAVDLVGNVMVEAYAWVFHTGSGGGGICSGTAERVRQTYAFGGKPVAIREQLGEVESVYWLHPDHLGSTTLVTDEEGAAAAERRYLPWGEERYVDAAVPTDRLYTGQIKDRYTELYYYNARYYDPWLGRFVQADTVVPGAGNPQNLNRYSYVRNSPLRHTDSTGHYIDLEAAKQGILRYMDSTGQEVLYEENLRSPVPPTSQGILVRLPTDQDTIRLYQGFGNTSFAYKQYANGASLYSTLAYLHSGLDMAMPAGDTVYSMSAGVVVGINTDIGDGGKSLAIQTGDKRLVYGHMLEGGFKEGDKIKAGQAIGTVQALKDPHLHFEVRDAADRDVFYNPLYLFSPDVVGKITGLDQLNYVNPTTHEVDSTYNAWSMVSYDRGTYGNFWTGTATATWR